MVICGMANRIREIRETKGLSLARVAELCGTTHQTIQRLEKGERQLTEAWMRKIADALSVKPADLVEGFAGADCSPSLAPLITQIEQIPVIGEVQAGVWHESRQWEGDEVTYTAYPLPAGLRTHAYGLVVAGDSMNQVYQEGDILIVIPLAHYTKELRSGQRVIVERRKRDGIVEATAKELVINDGVAELWPRSTNPKFQAPISIHWPYTDTQKNDTESVEIIGIIAGMSRAEILL